MKLALPLFFLGLLTLLGADYLTTLKSVHQLENLRENAPEVQAFLAQIDDLQDGANAPIVEKIVTGGYFDRLVINPGFRIIHDPTLTNKIQIKGPGNVLEYLQLKRKTGWLTPDFDRPVKLKEHVEIRLNLQAPGSRSMRISMRGAKEGRTVFQPDLVTEGPLDFDILYFTDLPDHPIQLTSRDVVIRGRHLNATQLQGTANRVEFLYRDADMQRDSLRLEAPNLKAQKVIRTKI